MRCFNIANALLNLFPKTVTNLPTNSLKTIAFTQFNSHQLSKRFFSSVNPRIYTLNNLKPVPGATQQRVRKGRGVGSKIGKTGGRGHKGSHARNSRGLKPWFIGGQTPLYRLIPKRGFKNTHGKRVYKVINLSRINEWILNGRIDPSDTITMRTLRDSGCIGHNYGHYDGFKLCSKGITKENTHLIPSNLKIEISDCSQSAKRYVEAKGGKIVLKYYNRLGFRAMLQPNRFPQPKREAVPKPRLWRKYAEQLCAGEWKRPKMGDWVYK